MLCAKKIIDSLSLATAVGGVGGGVGGGNGGGTGGSASEGAARGHVRGSGGGNELLPFGLSFAPGRVRTLCNSCGKLARECVHVQIGEHQLVQCWDCYCYSLDKIWFTFHPDSQHSSIEQDTAVFYIQKFIQERKPLMEVVMMLAADHFTDDGPEALFNRKTGSPSRQWTRKRRYQEIKHGILGFTDHNSHFMKTHREREAAHNIRGEVRQLKAGRSEQTLKHVESQRHL